MGVSLLSHVANNRMRGNGLRLHLGKFKLDRRKAFFTQRAVNHWNRLYRVVVDLPLLRLFKKCGYET